MSTSAVIADVRQLLAGDPVFFTGSLVAADTYGLLGYHDVDLFCPTSEVLVSTTTKLLCQGYTFAPRFDRVWARWLKMGFKRWHTNSMRLYSPSGVETNLVYKLADGHPTTSLVQVLESFDFGLLAVGWNLEDDFFLDERKAWFPQHDPEGPLPLMPKKRDAWRNGFISDYNGLREVGRYVKYHGYGYDMSLVKDDLCTGYYSAASYFSGRFEPEKQTRGKLYETIAIKIEDDEIDELIAFDKEIDYNDPLDAIMEALE